MARGTRRQLVLMGVVMTLVGLVGVGSLPAAAHQPLRVVAGTRPLPEDARLLDASAPTLVVTSHDPAEVLAAMTERGIHHVLLEGGATLAAAFLRAGLVDEVVAYLAPTLLGSGPAAVGDLGITTIADAVRLETTDVTVLGGDVRVTARPVRS